MIYDYLVCPQDKMLYGCHKSLCLLGTLIISSLLVLYCMVLCLSGNDAQLLSDFLAVLFLNSFLRSPDYSRCSVHVQWAGEMDLMYPHVLIVGVNPAGYCKDWETSVQWSSHLRCTGFPLPPKELSLYITFTLNYNIKHMQSFGHEAFNNAGQISHNTNQVKMYLT